MAQAFNIAYEKWQAHKKKKDEKKSKQKTVLAMPVKNSPVETISLGKLCLYMHDSLYKIWTCLFYLEIIFGM